VRQGSSEEIVDTILICVAAVNADTAWAVGLNAQGYSVIYHTTNGRSAWHRYGNIAIWHTALKSACETEFATPVAKVSLPRPVKALGLHIQAARTRTAMSKQRTSNGAEEARTPDP